MMAGFKDYLQAGNATEHTHRPALKGLLESFDPQVTATNEPQRIACGAPDFIVTRNNLTVGYIEAKDIGKSLTEAEHTDQLQRYRQALDNLILTDYLEFRWYVGGELLQGWREAFARVLLADLNLPEKTPEFADMFAQTLAYGLFTARMMDDTAAVFTRQTAQNQAHPYRNCPEETGTEHGERLPEIQG